MDKKEAFKFFTTRFHKNQYIAWEAYHAHRFLVLKCGRRWGKSFMASDILLDEGLSGDTNWPPTAGLLFIAKTRDQARKILWETIKERVRFRNCGHLIRMNEQNLEVKFLNTGITLSVEGADVEEERLRGTGKRLIVLDEFAWWKKNRYLWTSILRPMLINPTGGPGGKAIICSTPAYAENYFEDFYQRGLLGESNFKSLHFTTFENPMLSRKEIEDLAEEYGGPHTDDYKREILAITVRTSELVFQSFEDKPPFTMESADCPYYDPESKLFKFNGPQYMHYGGVDFGAKDPTVFLMATLDWEKDHQWIWGEHYKGVTTVEDPKECLVENHAAAMKKIMAPYTNPQIWSDHDPQMIMEYANVKEKSNRITMFPAEKDIRSGISRLIRRIQQRRVTIIRDRCPNLIRELILHAWDENRDKPAPNQSDHAIDAWRYLEKGINLGDYLAESVLTTEEELEQRVIRKLKAESEGSHHYD